MKLHLPVLLRKAIVACILAVAAIMDPASASLILGSGDSLPVDFADVSSIPNLNNGALQLSGGTQLQLVNCGIGDGKLYTLASGVSSLLDADGRVLTLDSTNGGVSFYFDTTRPGTGFWAEGTLNCINGYLQLLLHDQSVKTPVTLSSRKTDEVNYQYYRTILAKNLSSSYDGAAIYGFSSAFVTLSYNGSVIFEGNMASSSSGIYGGAICGYSTITLRNNGSMTFEGNAVHSASSFANGGAIAGITIAQSNNGRVIFEGNSVTGSSSANGGAIYGYSSVAMSNNGGVVFEGNIATSSFSASGGAIYGYGSGIDLCNNGNVVFEGNAATSFYTASGGAVYARTYSKIALRNNGSVYIKRTLPPALTMLMALRFMGTGTAQ